MTTISQAERQADVVEVTYDLDHTRFEPLDFTIEVVYPNSSISTVYTEPEVAFSNARNFVPVVDGAFTTAPNTRYIVFRFKLNNDNRIVEDNYVLCRLRPAPTNEYITNADPLEVSVEITDAVTLSTFTVDSPIGTVFEDDELITDYSFTPALGVASTVKVELVAGTAEVDEIEPLTYSTDGILFHPVAVDGNITLLTGTSGFSVKTFANRNPSYENKNFTLRATFGRTGSGLDKLITVSNTDNHPHGELISESCDGYNKMGLFHDGIGGTYLQMTEYRSPDCGFLFPPEGEVLSTFCAGFDQYQHLADGTGGHTSLFLTHNSLDCGYVAPSPNLQTELTPTTWDPATKGSRVTLSDNNRTYAGFERDGVRTVYSALFGSWYSEFTVYLPTAAHKPPSIGLVTSTHPMGNWIGSNANSWAWWPHEGTKYHADTQGFYGPEIEDGDVISLLYDNANHTLSFWLNGVDLGVMYDNLPTTTKLYIAINALNESFTIANFGQNAFVYEPPVGFYPGFGVLFDAPLERGTVVGSTCEHTTKYHTLADGKFGTYSLLANINSTECGWIPPPPMVGTVLSYFCTGLNYYRRVADGNNGSTEQLVQLNSPSCGYVPPPAPAFTAATLNPTYYANNTVFSNGNKTAELDSAVRASNPVYSGKWYWEIDTSSPAIAVGINTGADTAAIKVGHSATSFGWSIATRETYHKGVPTSRPSWPIVSSTDRVGVALDSVAQTLTFSVNGTLVGTIENIDIGTFYPAISKTGPPSPPGRYPVARLASNKSVVRVDGYAILRYYFSELGPGIGYNVRLMRHRDTGGGVVSDLALVEGGELFVQTTGIETTYTTTFRLPYIATYLGEWKYSLTIERVGSGLVLGSNTVPIIFNNSFTPDPDPLLAITSDKTVVAVGESATVSYEVSLLIPGKRYEFYLCFERNLGTQEAVYGAIVSTFFFIETDPGVTSATGTIVYPYTEEYAGTNSYYLEIKDDTKFPSDWESNRVSIHLGEAEAPEEPPEPTPEPVYSTPTVNVYFESTEIVGNAPTGFVKGFGSAATVYPVKGTYNTYYCTGTTQYRRYHDGGGGYYEELYQVNSPSCGWVAPRPYGEFHGYVCRGTYNTDLYSVFADGNYGFYETLQQTKSPGCGYKTAGTLISKYCNGFDQYGTYADGEHGTYTDLVAPNSRDCGYGGVAPESPLALTENSNLAFSLTGTHTGNDLVFKP